MAARMTEIANRRGRAYRCTPCGYTSRKCRIEEHFYKRHVTEHQVPFMCVVCEFRTGDNTKFVRHQESPGHMARVVRVQNLIALQESSAPRFMIVGQDVVKLSKDESAEHLIELGWSPVEDGEAKEEEVEDLRIQLLKHEPMRLTLPQLQTVTGPTTTATQPVPEVAPTKVTAEKASQTDPMSSETILNRIDTNQTFMYGQVRDAIQSMYSMHENLKVINRRQEEVILRLEKKLEASEANEKEREEKGRHNERGVGVNHERTREGEMAGAGAGATGAGVAGETVTRNNSKRKK